MMRHNGFFGKIILLLFVPLITLFSQADRSKPPAPGPPPEVKLGEYLSFKLNNGLKVFLVENHKLPRVVFKLVLDIDPVLEKDKAGYVSAEGQLLRTGTKTRSKDQLDKEIDFIGAELTTSSTGAFAMCLTEHAGKLAELLSDIIINPSFRQEELDKIKLRMKSDLDASKDDPEEIARVVRNVLVFGKDHPYGEPVTEQTIDNISLEDCKEYYTRFFRPNAAYLAVTGDITPEEAKLLVEKYFGRWEMAEVPEFKYQEPLPPDSSRIAIVDRPNSVQSVINVAYPVELKPWDKDLIEANVANTILGGGVFRLFKNLREKHGYTYGAYSVLRKDKLTGSFNAFANVRNEVTDSAVVQILLEMKRMKEEKVPDKELLEAKNYLTGNFAMQLEEPETIADFAINVERYNLPKNYYKDYLKNLDKVNSDEVLASSGKFIKPGNAYILIVGNADSIGEKLESATGIKNVSYFNRFGSEVNKISDVPLGLTASKIIAAYIDSIGGRENMLKITDRTTVLKGSLVPGDIDIEVTIYQKAPRFYMQKTETGGVTQKIVFNGQKGYLIYGDDKKEIKDDELVKLKYEATFGMLLNLDAYNVKVNLLGTEEVNGKKLYKIEMLFPSGEKWIQYYDPETGLKVKEEKSVNSENNVYTEETLFSDYREVEGVKYPFKIEKSLGRQKFVYNVDSIKVNSGLSERNFSE